MSKVGNETYKLESKGKQATSQKNSMVKLGNDYEQEDNTYEEELTYGSTGTKVYSKTPHSQSLRRESMNNTINTSNEVNLRLD